MNRLVIELEDLREQLKSARRSPKPKMLVVDDEPDNLDLLYRTFRRDFNVLKADSGARALELLAEEGEVAVIISDQRMPEMKGTEFLSKTVPEFPDTVRIILTGFTDVEDLVEAINSGQVYKYITKPWDPDELKTVVQRAADSYDSLKSRSIELERAQAQTKLLATILEASDGQIFDDCAGQLAAAFIERFGLDRCVVQGARSGQLSQGISRPDGDANLAGDPLTQSVLADRKMQVCINVAANPELAAAEFYQTHSVQAHVVIPALHRDNLEAVVSLQFTTAVVLDERELTQMYLAVQQAAFVLTHLS
ncbi:MAG: response regulator [Oscillatoriales cyanobacterium]|nr:MAG: response regulator [Oscillatoriales cyanobacterium]